MPHGEGPPISTQSNSRRRVIAAGLIGNMLEWYDFSIYGFFAFQIGATFFHGEDRIAQSLAAFGVFALGFITRPLGSIIIGHIGDRHGRAHALTISIVGMSAATVGMGLVPGYASIGVAAPILLTLMRMLQGLAVGGEASIAGVFMIENAPTGRRALSGALGGVGNGLGIQAGSLTALGFATFMSAEDLNEWGWRLPFLLSFVVGIAGFLIRRSLLDLPRPGAAERPSPVIDVFRNHLGLLFRIAALVTFSAVGFQTAFIYIADWLQTVDGLAPQNAFRINSASMLAITPVSLFFGWLSDHVGRRNLLLVGAAIGVVGSIPFFMLMRGEATAMIYLGQAGFILALGIQFGVLQALLVESTPEEIRCTALAVGNNIAWSFLGGFAPLAATWLLYRTGEPLSPAFLVVASAALTFAALLMTRDTFVKEIPPGRL